LWHRGDNNEALTKHLSLAPYCDASDWPSCKSGRTGQCIQSAGGDGQKSLSAGRGPPPRWHPRTRGNEDFAPYLSEALLHRIDLAVSCSADEARQHPDPHQKPEIAWLEVGLFSGDDEQASPRTFRIESSKPQKDGSFRVYVRLTWGLRPLVWRVAAIVVRENNHFVVDDVIYLKDQNRDVESRLSEYLSSGCDGPRWVGRSNQPNDLKH